MWALLQPGVLGHNRVSLDDALYLLELSTLIGFRFASEPSDVLLNLVAAMDICCGDDDTWEHGGHCAGPDTCHECAALHRKEIQDDVDVGYEQRG